MKVTELLEFLKNIPKKLLTTLIFLPIVLSWSFTGDQIPLLANFLDANPIVLVSLWLLAITSALLLLCELFIYTWEFIVDFFKTYKINKNKKAEEIKRNNDLREKEEINKKKRIQSIIDEHEKNAHAIILEYQKDKEEQELQETNKKNEFENKILYLTNPAKKILAYEFGHHSKGKGDTIRFESNDPNQGALNELVEQDILKCREPNPSKRASKGYDEYWINLDVYDYLSNSNNNLFKQLRYQTRNS